MKKLEMYNMCFFFSNWVLLNLLMSNYVYIKVIWLFYIWIFYVEMYFLLRLYVIVWFNKENLDYLIGYKSSFKSILNF